MISDKQENNLFIDSSPYSTSHEWVLHWNCFASNFIRYKNFNQDSSKEPLALDAISKVGLIGNQQLKTVFGLNKNQILQMVKQQKLFQHEISLKGKINSIYTLGSNGAVMLGQEQLYKLNYWQEYKVKDVMKRLAFFKLYQKFAMASKADKSVYCSIEGTPEPFVGAINYSGSVINVYVLRDDYTDFQMFMKWRGKAFSERLIIITENLRHIKPIEMYLQDLKVRVILDSDLQTDELQNVFYYLNAETGELVKEG